MFKVLVNRVKSVLDLPPSSWWNFNNKLEFYLDHVVLIFTKFLFLERQILQKYSSIN